MITCKEDLFDTYIKNDFGKLRDLYVSACNEFGIEKFIDCNLDLDVIAVFSCNSGMSDPWELIDINSNDEEDEISEMTELTLKDLAKPTPTKFVKVEEPIFDLKAEFENGELYSSDCEGCYTQLKCKKKLYLAGYQDSIYRQVEIDWRDELDSYLDSISNLDSIFDEKVTLEFSGSKFAYNMSDDEFVAACHLVASLTEKPEGV